MSHDDDERHARMDALYREIAVARAELVALLKAEAARPVDDVTFLGPDGPVRLSELFGDKDELVLSFNMGRTCPWCTCWGDAINGFVRHLQRHAAFACLSPDPPEVQRAFAASRGWTFPMVSPGETDFAAEMGFAEDHDGERHLVPGIATFRRTGGGIERVAAEGYGPGDPFNGLYHVLALLPSEGKGFQPKI